MIITNTFMMRKVCTLSQSHLLFFNNMYLTRKPRLHHWIL